MTMHSGLVNEQDTLSSQSFIDAGSTLNLNSPDSASRFVDVTNQYSIVLARDEEYRRVLGEASPSIWPVLHRLWTLVSDTQSGADDEFKTQLNDIRLSAAKFTRNLVAGNPYNQRAAFENENAIRRLIHHYTSFSIMKEAKSLPVTRMLVQTLSNIVTANEVLLMKVWNLFLNLPEEQDIFTRLIYSTDSRTVLTTLILVINCLHGNTDRATSLTVDGNGLRLLKAILHRMDVSFDVEDSSDESQIFELSYRILSSLVDTGLFPVLYDKVALEGEPVTPNQVNLLKILDSYLQHDKQNNAMLRALGPEDAYGSDTGSSDEHQAQSTTAEPGIQLSEMNESAAGQKQLDLLLPQVCAAIVLNSQCLISMLLAEEPSQPPNYPALALTKRSDGSDRDDRPTRRYLLGASDSGSLAFIESLIETLRLLDTILPRVTFGKVLPRPNPRPPSENEASAFSVRERETESTPGPPGFAYVKRDLTRLLGILCADDRAVQDRVRACGGIPVIMNLCVVDDHNPYLREHAIFTLRNLLHGNLENQAVVDAIKPVGRWDEYGVLQDIQKSQ